MFIAPNPPKAISLQRSDMFIARAPQSLRLRQEPEVDEKAISLLRSDIAFGGWRAINISLLWSEHSKFKLSKPQPAL